MIYVNPVTATICEPDDPEAVPVYVTIERGCLTAMIRATSREVFLAQAQAVGLLDDDGRPVAGVTITEIGPLVLSDTETDTRHHVNFWLSVEATERIAWIGWALAWTFYGGAITQINALENGAVYLGIELIDPDTVGSRTNVLL